MPIININSAEFYYETHGKGDPLVLVAGYACDHTFWYPVLHYLKDHYQVTIFDNRGIGQTKDQNETLSIELMAENLFLLLKKLNISKPHIIGHSMGGMIVLALAARYPDHIDKIGLLTSGIQCRGVGLFALDTLLQMRKANVEYELIFKCMLPWIFSGKFLKIQKNIDALWDYYQANKFRQSISDQERQLHALKNFDGRSLIKSIRNETLIVYGLQDLLSLSLESKAMANQISNSKLIELDCAHGVVSEIPQELARVIIDFF